MTPNLFKNYHADRNLVNPKFISKFGLAELSSSIKMPDLYYLRFRKFRWSTSFVLTTLAAFFTHVVVMCSNSEMARIAAGPTINTRMKNQHSFGSVRFILNNPRYSVRIESSSPAEQSFYCDLPITIRLDVGIPVPALVWVSYLNVGPESFLKFFREYLRQQFAGYNFRMHNTSCLLCLLCHAFGCLQRSARALSFYH